MRTILFILLLILSQGIPHAQTPEDNEKSINIDPDFYVSFHVGQYVKARYFKVAALDEDKVPYNRLWQGVMTGRLGFTVSADDWLAVKLSMESIIDYNNWPWSQKFNKFGATRPHYSFHLHEAYGHFTFLNESPNVGFDVSLGQFVYKYNPEVRDLGEYLFRTGTYPLYIKNSFDFPFTRLTGLRLGFNFATPAEVLDQSLLRFNIDGMLLTEREMVPFHDFSLAFLAKCNVFNAIELGGGVNFAHLISVDDSLTTPKVSENRYLTNDNDTGYYTFKGTKLMGRATIDPVFFLRGKEGFLGDFFGKEGFKFYTEIAFIGLKDYPAQADSINGFTVNPYGYDDLKRKRPVLLGFNIPLWKIADICAVEFEHLDSPYPNSFEKVIKGGLPHPVIVDSNEVYYNPSVYSKNNWKFCVYAKKYFGDNFGLILQISRDHLGWNTYADWQNDDFQEAFIKWDEWAWFFKTEFTF